MYQGGACNDAGTKTRVKCSKVLLSPLVGEDGRGSWVRLARWVSRVGEYCTPKRVAAIRR